MERALSLANSLLHKKNAKLFKHVDLKNKEIVKSPLSLNIRMAFCRVIFLYFLSFQNVPVNNLRNKNKMKSVFYWL